MIPTRLEAWTLDTVREVAASGIIENDVFDLKADLQPAEHQRKIAAAFANTRGGFLIFGVTNDRQVDGITNPELPCDFGTKLGNGLEPSVDYRFSTPFVLDNGRRVYVAEVPRSSRAPHAVFTNNAWVFLKRTAAGSNDPMSYEEIRLAFQDTETRRTKLALVSAELELIEAIANRLLSNVPKTPENPNLIYHWAWVTRYPTTLLDSVLGDAFSLLAGDEKTWSVLAYIRDIIRLSNTLAGMLANLTFSALSGFEKEKTGYQSEIRRYADELKGKCQVARDAIQGVLGGRSHTGGKGG